MEKAFFDVRIFHPNADSNRSKSLPQLYTSNENEKKRSYNQIVVQVEHGTFTALVFSTTGGESPECMRFHKRLATLLSNRRGEKYCDSIAYIRRKIRFCILRTTLIAIRGYRKPKTPDTANIIPLYEVDISVSEAAQRSWRWRKFLLFFLFLSSENFIPDVSYENREAGTCPLQLARVRSWAAGRHYSK